MRFINNIITLFKKPVSEIILEIKEGRKIEFYDGNMPCSKNSDGELELLCPECGTWINRQQFHHDWDWSGPHCPNCDSGGMDYFAKTSGPVSSGRG